MDTEQIILEAKEHLSEGAPKERVYEEAKAKFREIWLGPMDYADAIQKLAAAIEY